MTKQERKKLATALREAIEEAGGPTEVANFISERYEPITVQAVCGWEICPWRRAVQVAAAAKSKGGKTTAQDLCPELFEVRAA